MPQDVGQFAQQLLGKLSGHQTVYNGVPERDYSDDESIKRFEDWYREVIAKPLNLSLDPYDKRHYYDYVHLYLDGFRPPESGLKRGDHLPSKYKLKGHPRLFIDGVDTRIPSIPPVASIDTATIKQKLQDSSDNVMDEMLDTMLGIEGLHKFYGQETPDEPPEGIPEETPVQ